MRWILVALACVACKKPRDVGPGSAVLPARSDATVIDVATSPPADALPPDAAVDAAVDAAIAAAPVVDVEHLLDWETIGPLKLGMEEKKVLGILGAPKHKTEPGEEGATGETVSDWTWTGVTLGMAADSGAGPFHVRSISIGAPSTFATSRGIRIGSTLADVGKIYPRNVDEGNQDPNQYLVGSVYGGMLLSLKKGKVSSIFLGAMAF